MRIEAAAFDLDDTLLRDDRTISPFTVQAIRLAAARGVKIIPASGRAHDSMWPYVEQLGCADLVIACNGAEVWTPDSRLLRQAAIDVDTAREIMDFAISRDIYCHSYDEAGYFYSQRGKWADDYARTSGLRGRYVQDIRSAVKPPVTKILLMAEPESIAQLLPMCRQRFEGRAQVTCSKPWFMEFNAVEARKGAALAYCAGRLGFSMERTAAFGDSLNDLSMLEAAGYGVAMANAWPEIRARVPYTCGANSEDGAAHWLLRMLEEETAI